MQKAKYYDILEIPPDASVDVVRTAYRSLSRKYHPDTNPNAEGIGRFKLIQEAREVLCNSARRAEYDQKLADGTGFECNQVNGDFLRPMHSNRFQFATGKPSPEAAQSANRQRSGSTTPQSEMKAGQIRTVRPARAMTGIVLLCSLFAAAVVVVRIRHEPGSFAQVPPSRTRSPVLQPPGGAVVNGNLAAWTEPAQPRFAEDYRVIVNVQLTDAPHSFTVNDLIDGQIVGDDGFQQQIPYDDAAPNTSWITTDQNRQRITTPDQPVSALAGSVQFAFEVPAADRQTMETIQIRSSVPRGSDYWELVVNRSR